MTYTPTQVPANLDSDGLRKWTQDEFRRLAQAYADDMRERDELIANLTLDLTDAVADIAKLTNNQFARVSMASTSQVGIANATRTVVNFDTVEYNPTSIWNSTTKRFVPTIAGYYQVNWSVLLQSGVANEYKASLLYKNGADSSFGEYFADPATTSSSRVGSALVHVNGTTDYLQIAAYISGTASRDILANQFFTWCSIHMVKAD